ncbi:MAG: CDP-diacylglycerol--serine O-phosphatidyltransferase [Actinomycetota bacterium]|nr:CDP-diacylglycerol--serine O-phosphatidyltransferase [Actinomycetota bacterium]
MRQFLTLPNLVTSGNLAAGMLALIATRSSVAIAAALVAVAVVCDALDGILARRSDTDSAFGGNLDSLADLVSFGVVPGMALYWGPLADSAALGTTACMGFVLSGAWRLARFPLVKSCERFVGLPIPVAGLLVMVLLLWSPPAPLALLAAAVLSALMLSTVPFPTLAMCRRGATTVATRQLKVRSRDPLVSTRRRPRLASRARARLRRGRRRPAERTIRRRDGS